MPHDKPTLLHDPIKPHNGTIVKIHAIDGTSQVCSLEFRALGGRHLKECMPERILKLEVGKGYSICLPGVISITDLIAIVATGYDALAAIAANHPDMGSNPLDANVSDAQPKISKK